MLGRVELGGYADDGPPRHAEQLAPAIEYCCDADRHVTLDHVSAIAVGIGPGHVHRAARRRDHREGAGPGAARPDDPGAEPRPARVPAAPRARARRRRDRRAPQRALLRAVPDGARRRAARVGVRGRHRPTISSPSSRRAARRRCCAATARCGSPSVFARRRAGRARRARARRAEPGRAGRARGRAGTSGRSSARPTTCCRCTCARATPSSPGTGRTADVATARKLDRAARGAHRRRCAAGTCARCCASRRRCTRRRGRTALFVSELALRSTRAYVVARVGREVSATRA